LVLANRAFLWEKLPFVRTKPLESRCGKTAEKIKKLPGGMLAKFFWCGLG